MREVLIPNDMHPFVIEINGVEYRSPEGTTQNVPDEVASAIDAYKKSVLPAKPNSIFDSEGLSFTRADAGHALMVNNDGTDVIWQEPVANLDAAIAEARELAQDAKDEAEDAVAAAEDAAAAADRAETAAEQVDAPEIWDAIDSIIQADVIGHSELYDLAQLNSDGWLSVAGTSYVSVSKRATGTDAPFYPTPTTRLTALQTWSAVNRIVSYEVPGSLIGTDYCIGFWLDKSKVSASTQFKIYLLETGTNFGGISAVLDGQTETKGNAKYDVDKIVGNWAHFTLTVNDSLNSTHVQHITLGMNVATANDYVEFSNLVFVGDTYFNLYAMYQNINYPSSASIVAEASAARAMASASALYDYAPLDNNGWWPVVGNTYIEVSMEKADDNAPFNPYPMTKLTALSSWTSTNRILQYAIPTNLSGKDYTFAFWLKMESGENTTVKIYVAGPEVLFDTISMNGITQGLTYTSGNQRLIVDKIVENWAHVTIYVKDTLNATKVTNIYLGMNNAAEEDYIIYSNPVLVETDNFNWIAHYPNLSYQTKIDVSNPLSGKKVNWLGDSIMYGGGSDGNNGWIGRIADEYGCVFESKAVNGGMIIDPEDPNYASIALRCTSFSETSPDYVIFDGGTNDGFNSEISPLGTFDDSRYDQPTDKTTSFSSAFEYVIWQIITAYPNAKIGYIIPYKQISYNQSLDVYDITGKTYFDRAVEICEKWGVPYLDLRNKTALNYQVTALQSKFTDMVHINSDGYDYSYNIVAGWMKTL